MPEPIVTATQLTLRHAAAHVRDRAQDHPDDPDLVFMPTYLEDMADELETYTPTTDPCPVCHNEPYADLPCPLLPLHD